MELRITNHLFKKLLFFLGFINVKIVVRQRKELHEKMWLKCHVMFLQAYKLLDHFYLKPRSYREKYINLQILIVS